MSKNPQAIMDSVKVCDLSDSQDSQESQESDPEDLPKGRGVTYRGQPSKFSPSQ